MTWGVTLAILWGQPALPSVSKLAPQRQQTTLDCHHNTRPRKRTLGRANAIAGVAAQTVCKEAQILSVSSRQCVKKRNVRRQKVSRRREVGLTQPVKLCKGGCINFQCSDQRCRGYWLIHRNSQGVTRHAGKPLFLSRSSVVGRRWPSRQPAPDPPTVTSPSAASKSASEESPHHVHQSQARFQFSRSHFRRRGVWHLGGHAKGRNHGQWIASHGQHYCGGRHGQPH